MKITLTALLFFFIHSSQIFGQEKINVVCSVSIIADLAKEIVGDVAHIITIVPIGGDPHLYEATPRDAKTVGDADIVFINGLNFEGWIEELIENSGTKASTTVVTEGVDAIASSTYTNSFDPHAWMDVGNGLIYAKNISHALIQNFPNHKAEFEQNFQTLEQKLIALDTYIMDAIQTIPAQQRILVTSHDAFNYYGRKYKIDVEAILGISTEADARTSDIARVSKVVKDRKVPAIFIESTINPKLIKRLADDNGVPIGGELYADSLGEADSEAGTYIGMLRSNTDVIVNALSKGITAKTKIDQNSSSRLGIYLLGGLLVLLLIFGVYKMSNNE